MSPSAISATAPDSPAESASRSTRLDGPSSIRIRQTGSISICRRSKHPRLSAPRGAHGRAQHRGRADRVRLRLAGRPDAAGRLLRHGPDADHRVSYRLDTTDTTAASNGSRFDSSPSAAPSRCSRPSSDREPTDAIRRSQSTFDPASAPGLNGLPAFLRGDAIVGFDWRDS